MAGTRFDLKFDTSDVLKVNLLMGDIKNGVPKVMTRAINKTLTSVQSVAVKTIAIDLNLTQERIREDFYINKATWEYVAGSVVAKGRPVNFTSFIGTTEKISEVYGGVSVKLKKSGPRVMFHHGFIWTRTTKSGDEARTAFERDAPPYHTFNSRFLPWKKIFPEKPALKYKRRVKTLTGPRIEDEYAKDRVMQNVLIEAKPILDDNLDHELEYELSKLR